MRDVEALVAIASAIALECDCGITVTTILLFFYFLDSPTISTTYVSFESLLQFSDSLDVLNGFTYESLLIFDWVF